MSSMSQRRSYPRVRLKARADSYLDRARELFGFSNLKPALLRQALIAARKSLIMDPRNYDTLVLLGSIYSDFDDRKSTAQALRYYNRAIALRPESPDGYDAKAGLLMHWLHRPEEAERLARKALALSVQTAEATEFLELRYTTLIDILIGRRKYTQARWLIRRALRDCPTEFMRDMVEQPLIEIASSAKGSHSRIS